MITNGKKYVLIGDAHYSWLDIGPFLAEIKEGAKEYRSYNVEADEPVGWTEWSPIVPPDPEDDSFEEIVASFDTFSDAVEFIIEAAMEEDLQIVARRWLQAI